MKNLALFSSLSDEARLWIYAVDRPLEAEEMINIESSLDGFIEGWHSHGRKVKAESAILYNRFILIAAEIPEAEISGCGIDASVHAIESIGQSNGFSLLSGLIVYYKDSSDSIHAVSRSAFRQLVRAARVSAATVVFDPGITSLTEFKEGGFELQAGSSWHSMVFRIPSETVSPPDIT